MGNTSPENRERYLGRVSAELVGSSMEMVTLRRKISRVARSVATVLVTGPSGSGKENVARAIHAKGSRAAGPFIAVNCGAIPAELAEAELFGAEAGAYTGAQERRIGKIEAAEGGTLFLDEIGDLPLALQAKLLRVLETRFVTRLGETHGRTVDIRVVAATNVNLEKAVSTGHFRNDLYWRIAVVCLDLLPLARHAEDIPDLVQHFSSLEGQPVALTADGLRELQTHDWPGNVRELRNLIERAAAMEEFFLDQRVVQHLLGPRRYSYSAWVAEGGMEAAPKPSTDLPPFWKPARGGQSLQPGKALDTLLRETERALIMQALEATGGTVAASARMLGIKRTTLVEKMKRIGLSGTQVAAPAPL